VEGRGDRWLAKWRLTPSVSKFKGGERRQGNIVLMGKMKSREGRFVSRSTERGRVLAGDARRDGTPGGRRRFHHKLGDGEGTSWAELGQNGPASGRMKEKPSGVPTGLGRN
jgi:hypothetical protein